MVAVHRPLNEILAKPCEVRHTGSEHKQLADFLKSLNGETRVIMEHIGRYYEPIAQHLHDAGLYVSAMNPKLIKDSGSGNTLCWVKTDNVDAKKVAKYGPDNWADLWEYTLMDTIRNQLKMLNRQCGLYTKTKTMMKNNSSLSWISPIPVWNALFDSPVREDGTQKWVDFAVSFWPVDCVRGKSQTAFTEAYRKWYKKHRYNFSSDEAAEVYGKAGDQFADYNSA